MVDSIRLIINDFKIDTDRCEKLSWDQNIYNYNKCNGDRCICNKTYGKEILHGYNLKVKGGSYFITEHKGYTYLHTNMPKLVNPEHNLYPLNKEQARDAFKKLYRILYDDGIELDLSKGILSRVDLFKNIYLDSSYDAYTPFLDTIYAPRLTKKPYEESKYLKNSLRELIFYDKKLELREKQKVKGIKDDIMRIEYRMLKRKKCKDDLPFDTFESLINNWDSLFDIYIEKMTKLIFNYADEHNVSECKIASDQDELIWYKNNFKRGWFQKYLLANGTERVLEKVGDSSVVFKEISENSLSARPTTQIEMLSKYARMSKDSSKNGRTVGDMYKEIHSKLIAPINDYLNDYDMIQ